MQVAVFTVDQRDSRGQPDLVPALLDRLASQPTVLGFERTAGDELQGVVAAAQAVPVIAEALIRDGRWNIGIGFGSIDLPLPQSARAGRGAAYVNARRAVTAAKASPWNLRVVGTDDYRAQQLETVLWLWAAILSRRTPRGWEVIDLVDRGMSYDDAGRHLGISQSAVSQRARAAGLVEGKRARELTAQLATELLSSGG